MRTIQLGEVLTGEQLQRVTAIVNQSKTFDECCRGLKEYFKTIEPHLRGKEILPDYLALVVAWVVRSQPKKGSK